MNKILSITGANLRRLFRDRSNIFFVFILPIGIIILIGSLFGSGFEPGFGVVGPSGPGFASDLARRLDSAQDFSVTRYESRDDLLLAVERGTTQAGVVIPDNYDQVLRSGGQAEVGFVARPDGVGPQLQAALEAAIDDEAMLIRAARLVTAETNLDFDTAYGQARSAAASLPEITVDRTSLGDALFPPTLGQFDLGASQELILFMFLTGLTGSTALIQTRQLGVSRRMLSTATHPWTIVLGEVLGRYGVVLVQGLYILFATLVAFKVNWGDPLGAAAIMLLFGAVAAGVAILFGTLFRNEQQAAGIGVIAGLGLAALGGCMVPIDIFSPTMKQVAHITPHAWALDGFAELVRRHGSIGDILPQLGVLAAYAVVILGLAAWRFRVVVTRAA